jgi:hypothetical protein
MKGSEIATMLGPVASPRREEVIVDAVRQGLYLPIQWCEVESQYRAHTCKLYVASDALCLILRHKGSLTYWE